MSDEIQEGTTVVATVRRSKKKAKKSKPNGAAGAGQVAVDSNSRTISITLPKDVLAWYEKQAAIAPFEPSVQKYIAWQLKQFASARQSTTTGPGPAPTGPTGQAPAEDIPHHI